jgi:hypothetical protein
VPGRIVYTSGQVRVIPAVLFLVAGLVIGAAAIVAILATVDIFYLSGSRAVADDGLRRGAAAPRWALIDGNGHPVRSPPTLRPLQMIVFADHSLRSFPSVAEGLAALSEQAPHLEIIVLTRNPAPLARPALESLGLGHLPVVAGSPALYGKYNVRVMPFIICVDSVGRVRASSLVNHAWQVEKLWRLAEAALAPGEMAPVRGRLARRVRAGV